MARCVSALGGLSAAGSEVAGALFSGGRWRSACAWAQRGSRRHRLSLCRQLRLRRPLDEVAGRVVGRARLRTVREAMAVPLPVAVVFAAVGTPHVEVPVLVADVALENRRSVERRPTTPVDIKRNHRHLHLEPVARPPGQQPPTIGVIGIVGVQPAPWGQTVTGSSANSLRVGEVDPYYPYYPYAADASTYHLAGSVVPRRFSRMPAIGASRMLRSRVPNCAASGALPGSVHTRSSTASRMSS